MFLLKVLLIKFFFFFLLVVFNKGENVYLIIKEVIENKLFLIGKYKDNISLFISLILVGIIVLGYLFL